MNALTDRTVRGTVQGAGSEEDPGEDAGRIIRMRDR